MAAGACFCCISVVDCRVRLPMSFKTLPPAELLGELMARDPYPLYRLMRESGRPLFLQHASNADITSGRWLLSTYAQAQQVLADTTHFTKVSSSFRLHGPVPGFDSSMLFMDEPGHRRLRSLVEDLFRRRSIAGYEAIARSRVQQLFDALPVGTVVNFISNLAESLPLLVLADLLGLPDQHIPLLARLSQVIRNATDDFIATDIELAEKSAATRALHDLLYAGLDGAWELPEGSLISRLQLLLASDGLSRDQAISMLILLLFAGHETSASIIGSAVFLFLSLPDQRRLLHDDVNLLPAFIEESLRLESPLQRSTYRITTCELELSGQRIPPGEQVCLLLGSANRDERIFVDSESFRIDRSPNPHLAFGRGNYHCLGRHLAVLEVRVVLQALMRRYPRSTLAGEPTWNANGFLRSLVDLPLILLP